MSYTNIRMESRNDDGTKDVVAYFAPNFEVNPVMKNDVFAADRPRGRGTIARDNQMYRYEIVIQGAFEDTRNLPGDHAQAVADLDSNWSLPVTPRQQVRRIQHYLLNVGGPFELYEGEDEYTAYDVENADFANGVFPTVQVDEFRPTRDMGSPRFEYMVKMIVGADPSEDPDGA